VVFEPCTSNARNIKKKKKNTKQDFIQSEIKTRLNPNLSFLPPNRLNHIFYVSSSQTIYPIAIYLSNFLLNFYSIQAMRDMHVRKYISRLVINQTRHKNVVQMINKHTSTSEDEPGKCIIRIL
jgi:hypothetical protein